MHFFDSEYFVPAAHSGVHDRVPLAIREREPYGDRGPRDRGDTGEHAGGGGVCEGDGSEKAEGVSSPLFHTIIKI